MSCLESGLPDGSRVGGSTPEPVVAGAPAWGEPGALGEASGGSFIVDPGKPASVSPCLSSLTPGQSKALDQIDLDSNLASILEVVT